MDDENLPALVLHALQGLTQAGQARRLPCFFETELLYGHCALLAFFDFVMLGLQHQFLHSTSFFLKILGVFANRVLKIQ